MKKILLFIFLILIYNVSADERFDKAMDLTAEQKEKIKIIVQKGGEERFYIVNDLKIKKIELEKLVFNSKPVKADIEKKLKEISDLEYRLRLLKLNAEFDILALLNDEQQFKYKRFLLLRLKENEKNREEGFKRDKMDRMSRQKKMDKKFDKRDLNNNDIRNRK